ncbi:MAG: TRZ/ATZ family hydrolase [Pseudomonadales bacterium]|nr:TRZ/ATZ family hydrolase [Halioglobus sp.]MCP5122706.1 TRZ/ATZ family hydrolase [Pseudomonadales bacterium]MCP5191876.1 TRZ/ATZ family hydrolase [Pseudomonadales bacterium]
MNPQAQTADTLIHPGWIVPVVPRGAVLENYSIALTGDRITAILPRREAEAISAARVLELPGHALMPGLVNSHGHAAMSLLRGYADDQPLMPWLEQHIWPAEAAHVSAAFVRDGAELAIAEMIRSGTTTFSDMYFFPDACAETAQRLGMRCQIVFPVLDFATVWARSADEYISKGLALRDDVKHSALVTVGFGPHASYTVSEPNLVQVATLAAELDVAVQIHLHETRGEVLLAVEQNGERPLDSLHRLGLLGPRTQCVHMTDLGDQDIALLAATGAHVVHCPQSNMKLASGTCPVTRLLARGINVALGSDSAASNNDLNLFGEMQTAALLAKLSSEDATALPAVEALAMATINGARALGLDDRIGSLEPGKLADLIAVDLSQPETQPLYHPLSQLVYACNGSQVTHSWIGGVQVMDQRQLTRIDPSALGTRTRAWRDRIHATHQDPR